MADYPGVDPDGLIPGGLQVAGKVNAGALAVLGQAIVPDVFGWGTWSGDTGIVVPHNTTVHLPFDSEDKVLKYVTFSNPDNKVTFNTAGTYIAYAVVFENTSTSVTGFIQIQFILSAGFSWGENAGRSIADLAFSNPSTLILCDVEVGATLSVGCTNHGDADDNFGTEIAIARLA